ncbi:MAG: AAA family ATPase [Gammaproteobacteria bacterium]|nr:AAA family ATPase [Gammaproteobacteria bacterium]
MTTDYTPPDNLWDMDAGLQFNEALEIGDPRYINTTAARGDYRQNHLLLSLGVDQRSMTLRARHNSKYLLFCGHRGCGKSTELRRMAHELHRPQSYFVIFLDALQELDYNNLQYADVLLALAKILFERLIKEKCRIADLFLENLQEWFKQRIETNTRIHDFTAEIKAGAKAESGLPFLGKLFAGFSTAMRNNSSYKEELRMAVENSFGQFAGAFNLFVQAAEEALREAGLGQKILFVTDGTDRLRDQDAQRFFIRDVHQLKQIQAAFVYCAPIHLLYEGNQVQNAFDDFFILPMVKLHEKTDDAPLAEAYDTLRALIDRRAAPGLFAEAGLKDSLIQYSGGSPRELLKLLHYAFLRCDGDQIDQASVNAAVSDLATDYKRILDKEDYPLLKRMDMDREDDENSERARFFLYHLILLEYNGYWRRSHPVIRLLPGYTRAAAV